jgi:glycosyltransferase involved in cell wall biosynthesis
MHVLLVSSLYAPYIAGGAEVIVEYLAKRLVEMGHRVTVVSSCGASESQSRTQQDGVDVWRFFPPNLWWLYDRQAPGDSRSAPAIVAWRLRDAWNAESGRRFGAILKQTSPDVVHTHYFKGFSPAIWRQANLRSIPIVHTAHSYELICTTGSLLRRGGGVCRRQCVSCRIHGGWYCWQTRMVDVFCSPSRFLLDVHTRAGVLASRFEIVRNGAVTAAPRAARPLDGGPVRFLYLGQLIRHKGVQVLLDAVARLTGESFVLDIAGKGPLEDVVRDAARSDSRIRFHGFVLGAQKQSLLDACDVLVFPSLWVENAPVTIMEAFSNDLAVVATDLGASPEFVRHGVNGLLFAPEDVGALASSLQSLVESPRLVSRLREGAAETARDLPTIDGMARAYLQVYQSIVQRPEG